MQAEDRSFAVDPGTGEVLREFPYPWPLFRKELEARLSRDPARVIQELKIPFYFEIPVPAPEYIPSNQKREARRKDLQRKQHTGTKAGYKTFFSCMQGLRPIPGIVPHIRNFSENLRVFLPLPEMRDKTIQARDRCT